MRMLRWELEEENLPRLRWLGARGHIVNLFIYRYLEGFVELRSAQFGSEQEPGPRGSPQEPQAPVDRAGAAEVPLALTANTESCGASLLPWHLGHSAFWSP